MATAAQIIKQAMQDLGVLGAGKSPSSNDQTDVFARLNDMVDTWSNVSLLIPFNTQISHVLDGSASYTIGAAGDIVATRPVDINSAFCREAGYDYPVSVYRDRAAFDRIGNKTTTGRPRVIYYDPSVPHGTIHVWYIGNSIHTLYLNTRGHLTQFADTTTDVDLAPGYKKMMVKNLAVDCAPMFEVSVSAELAKAARETMGIIKRQNTEPPIMENDYPRSRNNTGYWIEEG